MGSRIDYGLVAPDGIRSLRELETHLRDNGLEPALLERVKVRASILNGCAFCIDMHSKDGRVRGEPGTAPVCPGGLAGSALFQRTGTGGSGLDQCRYSYLARGPRPGLWRCPSSIPGEGLADLTLAVVAINAWNRLAIAFRTPAGSYRPDLV